MNYQKAMVIGGFPLSQTERKYLSNRLEIPGMVHLAVDGGLLQYLLMDRVPDMFIGDLDSVGESVLYWYFRRKSNCILLKKDKDFLDMEAAIEYLTATHVGSAEVWGVTGGRMDQTFACIPLLKKAMKNNLRLTIFSGNEKIGMLDGEREMVFNSGVGDTWSFIPIGGDVTGVSLKGFQFQLEDKVLKSTETVALSNVSVSKCVSIKMNKGTIMYFNKTGRREDVE